MQVKLQVNASKFDDPDESGSSCLLLYTLFSRPCRRRVVLAKSFYYYNETIDEVILFSYCRFTLSILLQITTSVR